MEWEQREEERAKQLGLKAQSPGPMIFSSTLAASLEMLYQPQRQAEAARIRDVMPASALPLHAP